MEGSLSMILNIAIGQCNFHYGDTSLFDASISTLCPSCISVIIYAFINFLLVDCWQHVIFTAEDDIATVRKLKFTKKTRNCKNHNNISWQLYRKRNLLLHYLKWCVSCLTVLIIMFTLIILIGFKYLLVLNTCSLERSEEKSVLFIKLRNRSDRRAFIILEGLICSSYLVSALKPKCNVCFQFRSVRL